MAKVPGQGMASSFFRIWRETLGIVTEAEVWKSQQTQGRQVEAPPFGEAEKGKKAMDWIGRSGWT